MILSNILSIIVVWIVLKIGLKLIKREDVAKNSRFYVSVVGVAVAAYLLQSILFLLYTYIFGQFNLVSIHSKIITINFLALLVSTFLFLLFFNKLTVKQSFFIGIAVGLFANSSLLVTLLTMLLWRGGYLVS